MNRGLPFFVLQLLATTGVGISRIRKILDWVKTEAVDLPKLYQEIEQLNRFLTTGQLADFIANEEKAAGEWVKLSEMNVDIVVFTDPEYPHNLVKNLENKAPPVLWVIGNKEILKKASVGFCGSRKASEKGLSVAKDCADQLSRQGINVVSGYAAGIDIATHRTALESGGTTAVVLPEGIFNFRVKRDIQDAWDWERVVVISEFQPGLPWRVHNAMQRNHTICGLSSAMVLIEAGEKGGSMEAGKTCIEMGLPLFATDYDGTNENAQGNEKLLKLGATAFRKNRQTSRANVRSIIDLVQGHEIMPLGNGDSETLPEGRPAQLELLTQIN